MYWSDCGKMARIERAVMDGNGRTELHTGLGCPDGLTLDYTNQKIYWIDEYHDTIEYSSMDGSNRVLLDRRPDDIFHPFSLTLYMDRLFWTDLQSHKIFSTHSNLPDDNIVAVLDRVQTIPQGIEVVSQDRQQEGESNTIQSVNTHAFMMCIHSH